MVNLDDENFNSTTKSNIALVDFWADWCAPCKMMNPILNELANEVDENVKICKLNVDTQQKLAMKFGVRSIPTLIILKNGKEVSRFVGVKPKHYLLTQMSLIK
ncbi:MAG: thioredoxin [Ignavibacteria bacterium GWF2_33_9]|nr:MAG: thioredoxin [Ignavibacteria bacterium GWF2_33_9]